MLYQNALGLSTIVWREFECPKKTARVILKRSDGWTYVVTSRSHLSLYPVLLLGEFEIFLVPNVFNHTFTFIRLLWFALDARAISDFYIRISGI
jgi:hypothetical protein